jgi:hypothetical protein
MPRLRRIRPWSEFHDVDHVMDDSEHVPHEGAVGLEIVHWHGRELTERRKAAPEVDECETATPRSLRVHSGDRELFDHAADEGPLCSFLDVSQFFMLLTGLC